METILLYLTYLDTVVYYLVRYRNKNVQSMHTSINVNNITNNKVLVCFLNYALKYIHNGLYQTTRSIFIC